MHLLCSYGGNLHLAARAARDDKLSASPCTRARLQAGCPPSGPVPAPHEQRMQDKIMCASESNPSRRVPDHHRPHQFIFSRTSDTNGGVKMDYKNLSVDGEIWNKGQKAFNLLIL